MRIIHIPFLLPLIFILYSCSSGNPEKSDAENTASIKFENTVHDFGTIPYESDGRCFFEFTNDSDQPLIVNVVRTSCGCTRPEWPEDPVQPGETGKIGITYNTRLKGRFQKSITVYSNAENSPVRLIIKGNVEPNKKD